MPLLLYKISQPGEFFIGQGWVVVERQLRNQRVLIFRQFVQKNLLSLLVKIIDFVLSVQSHDLRHSHV